MRQLIEEMVLLVQLESGELTGIGERADVDARSTTASSATPPPPGPTA